MFGPGEYVPDPTEGIVDVHDLPGPTLVAYDRNHDHPCNPANTLFTSVCTKADRVAWLGCFV